MIVRNNILWLRYRHHGNECRESTKLPATRQGWVEARKMLKEKVKERMRPNFVTPDVRRVTIAQLKESLFADYTARQKQRRIRDCTAHWKHLEPVFGSMHACDLTKDHTIEYRRTRLEQGASQTTINRELETLRTAYRVAAASEPPKVVRVPKILFVEVDNARRVFLSTEQVDALKTAAAQYSLWARCFIEILFTYGWRKGEPQSMLVRDVDLAARELRLQTSKNGEPRTVPITPALHLLLTALVTDRGADERLFNVSDKAVRSMWTTVCAAAGLKAGKKDGGYIMHDARRTSARNKRSAGVPTSVIMKISGWKTEQMFRRYSIVDSGDMLRALAMEESSRIEKVDKLCTPELETVATN